MDKLRVILSAGAMLSLVAGTANAGRLMDMQGDPSSVTGTGVVNTVGGFQEMGSPYTGGQGLEGEGAAPFSVPAPGTINMRVNSFVNEFPMAAWWTGMNGTGTPAANAGNKQQAYGVYGWIRIDLGIDGMTKNGVQYGAFTEIRENNTTSISGGTASLPGVTSTAATGLAGASVTSGFAQSASGDSGDNILYVRHAFAYVGTTSTGFIRIGDIVYAQSLMQIGLFDDFDIGGWISFASSNIPSNMAPVWPWADEGGAYMAAGVAYLSPVIAGFDAVVSFIPNNSTPFDGSGCSSAYGGMGCATQSSSLLAGDFGRYRNEFAAAVRYRNTFGPVGVAVSGIWTVSGKVNDAASPFQPYNGLNIGDVGAEISLNKVLDVGGNVMWGAFNGNWGLQPKGGANAVAWTAGIKYTIPQIPMTLGTYYFNYLNQGVGPTAALGCGACGQRTYQGLDVGAVYGFGPGVVAVAEYAWGQNYQGGYDFLTASPGLANNKVQAQVATVGLSLRF